MIITFGANTWRSDRSSSSASQIRFETAPARTANRPYGHRRAATRPPPSSVKSRSGAPPSASTPRPPTNRSRTTADRGRPLATKPRPRRCPVQPQPRCRFRETPYWWTLSRSPARRSTSHAPTTRCSSKCPARATLVSASVSSRDLGDQRLHRPEPMARRKKSMYTQDRLRFSEALRLGDNSHRNRAVVSTGCRSTGLASVLCWIVVIRRTRAPLDYERPRPPSEAVGGQA
jgi:hypothetical protein